MELDIALITYLAIIIGSFLIVLYVGYTIFASFMIALIIGLIYINIVFPITRNELDDITSLTALYIFVQIFTIVVFVIYALITTLSERRNKKRFTMRYYDV